MASISLDGFVQCAASTSMTLSTSPSNDQGQQASKDDNDKEKKKGPDISRSTRPVTIKQIVRASMLSEDKFVIDNHDITNISVVGIIREISQLETFVSFKIEDSTGSMDIKYWLEMMTGAIGETDGVVASLQPDDYVTVTGRIQQFNNRRSCIAISFRRITEFNEVTYHFLHAIYTHLTIGKTLKFMLELDLGLEDDVLSKSRPFNFPDNSQIIVKRAIRQCSDEELGADVKAVVFHLRNVIAESKVMGIINNLSLQGEIYNTYDENIKLIEF